MPKSLLLALFASGAILAAASCNRTTCRQANAVFASYPPSTKQYADELVRQLKLVDKSTLTYWLDAYQQEGNSQRLVVRLQGDGLCAQMPLTIKGSLQGIEQLVANKGMGYHNAELKNLRFDVQRDNAKTEFIFSSVDGVVD